MEATADSRCLLGSESFWAALLVIAVKSVLHPERGQESLELTLAWLSGAIDIPWQLTIAPAVSTAWQPVEALIKVQRKSQLTIID